MKFHSLNLVGFKSFANKTQMTFDDHITAIVGPNGCGKSNLFDALSWVLGAQNAREMRGQKMEDFIFGGTRKRKLSGMAQASLSVNLDTTLELEINGKTITDDRLEICRKLYRSGESVYLVNGQRCRLKDIHQLLEEIGLDCASYALIAQGKIASLMTAKPLERRLVIEEAARITGYKNRRRRTELKLEMAEQNLLRVNDIILEIERRLRSLKRQAAKARRYKRLREEFRNLQEIRFVVDTRVLQDDLKKQNRQLNQLNQEFSRIDKKLQGRLVLQNKQIDLRNNLENNLSKLSEQSSRLLLEIDRTKNTISNDQEQIETKTKYLKQLDAEKVSIEESINHVTAEKQRFQKEIENLYKETVQNVKIIDQNWSLVEKSSLQVSEVESSVEDSRNKIMDLSSQMASLNGLLKLTDSKIQELQDRKNRLTKDHVRTNQKTKNWEEECKRNKKNIKNLNSQCRSLGKQLSKLKSEKEILGKSVEELQNSKASINNQLIALRERLQSLQEIDISHSQYSGGVQKLLNSLTDNGSSIVTEGTLADQIETTPEFEQLVENFLDSKLEYVLVNSMDEAKEGLDKALKLKSGKCSFLALQSNNGFGGNTPFPKLPQPASSGVVGTVSGLLKMDENVKSAFQRVLPKTANAVVVSNLEKAFELAHYYPDSTFLALDGTTLAPRGLLTANLAATKKLGPLSLKRRTKDAEVKSHQVQHQNKRLKIQLASEIGKLEERKLKIQDAKMNLDDMERRAWQSEIKQEQIQSNLDRKKKSLLDLNQKLTINRDDITSLKKQKNQIQKELTNVITDKLQYEHCLNEATDQLAELRTELNRVQQQHSSSSFNQKVLLERKKALEDTLVRISKQKKGFETRQYSIQETMQKNKEQIAEMSSNIKIMSTNLFDLSHEEMKMHSQLSKKQSQYEHWKSEDLLTNKNLDRLRKTKEETQQSRTEVQVETARIKTKLQVIEDQCREQLQKSIPDLLDTVSTTSIDSAATQERYASLQNSLDRFGPVNMTALDEYQENEERYNFLIDQKNDLETSISDTQKAIKNLNKRSREQFKEAFIAVNQNFKKVFQALFGGGDCGMRLLDEEDLLESGLEIFAQPPGKRLQNVMLLSGGEKALTVFALLVGLFEYRPSQFCVLDEVDAPLDDANVHRFTELLRKMSTKTQVIVVTHNKQTMEVADSLFGVTMEEPGISEIVSLKI